MNPGAWHLDPARDVIVPALCEEWQARNAAERRWQRQCDPAQIASLCAHRGSMLRMRRVWHELRGR